MIDLSYDFIVALQKEVLYRFGVEVMLPGDCKHLSQSILDATTKLVSETTLKRVFGFAVAQHSFSRYTLNTLSQYCRYKDWEDFQTHQYKQLSGDIIVDNDKWSDLKNKADAVSYYTIVTLKNRSGIPFNNTVPRQYCTAHIERFLESDYAATALIAPSGWGKSVSLVHLAEHFWFGREARYKQDICWFIHAHAAGSLLLKGFSLSSWLDNQLNLGSGENFREYFARNFDKKGGRLVLIIDGFDEIAVAGDKLRLMYTKLEDFVYSNDLFPWVKVILSIRSNTWSEIFQHSVQYPAFRRYWYVGAEMDEETNTNLPLLTEQEVKSVLYSHQLNPATVRTFSEPFLQKLRYPYYLQLFCQLNTGPDQSFIDERLSLFEIVSRFVQQRVFNSQNNSFKIRILDQLLALLDYGRNGQYTDKLLLLNQQDLALAQAYKELLADNILVEENLSQEIMFHVKVRFAHNFLLEYFTAMHFMRESGQQLTDDMLQQILTHFPASAYRGSIFKWLLRYAINQRQTDNTHKILCLPLSNLEKSVLLEYLVLHYQQEGDRQPDLKHIFPPGYFKKYPLNSFISDDFLHPGKRKVLTALLTLAEAPEDRLKIRSILFRLALLQLDAEQCEAELNNIKKICGKEPQDEGLWVSPYEICLFIYEYLKFGIVNEGIREKIYDYARYWNGSSRQPITVAQEVVYRNMGFIFLLLEDYEHLFNFSKRLFAYHPTLPYRTTDSLRQVLLCWQAYAQLQLGHPDTASRICRHVDIVLSKNATDRYCIRHVETLQKIIMAHVYNNRQEYNKALRATEGAMEIALKQDMKLLALLNFSLLRKIYKQLQLEKQLDQAQQQVELFHKSTSFKQTARLW
ncbi:hypothetical protein [Chitinophaga sp. GbtcB8]|uniref:hypothetical protein n=1 Tax=Chitinophaga sp. GbtcB8 TaxID=2824753 RepID=UPI001C310125|nr:hypothetical protein [Chitinophaga sp. GbtcB8]